MGKDKSSSSSIIHSSDQKKNKPSIIIEKLEENVQRAVNAKESYSSLRDRGIVPENLDTYTELVGNLMKAEDDLARSNFGRRVEREWERIDALVANELERIANLDDDNRGGELGVENQCAICNKDMRCSLETYMKFGTSGTRNAICCGKRICKPCEKEAMRPHKESMKGFKRDVKKFEKEGGEFIFMDGKLYSKGDPKLNPKNSCGVQNIPYNDVMVVQDIGDFQCPICNKVPPKTDKEKLRKIKEHANDGRLWAMEDMSLAFAKGKYGSYGSKRNPNKARKWLIKASDAGFPQSQYHLGECYYAPKGTSTFWGHTEQSYEKAHELYMKAANSGHPGAYLRLAEMYTKGHGVEECPETAMRYASLAVREVSRLQGRNYAKLAMHYITTGKKDAGGRSLGLTDEAMDLSLYWIGLAASAEDGEPGNLGLLSSLLGQCAADDYWYKNRTLFFPGYSTLPLVRLLEKKSGCSGRKGSPFISHWKERCGNLECKNTAKGLKVCQQCGVFHYCSRACQLRHWKLGHKRDCRGTSHWILEHFPDLQL